MPVAFQPDYRRLLKTIAHEEPDRVPLADFQADTALKDRFMGRPVRTIEDHVAFQAAAGFDFICAVMRRVIKMPGVVAAWYGDDLAYTESLLVSPKILRKYFFPWIEELAPGGGYGLASGAGLTRYVALENFLALREALWEYGTYPIQLEQDPVASSRRRGVGS